eukprot:GHVH01002206.1.p1 GENE.GHVH01002206.1~~GHVH01002206.1.p1  ORF type:complete len:157 (+),score=12.71 GHVH01002206.1:47-517(+)
MADIAPSIVYDNHGNLERQVYNDCVAIEASNGAKTHVCKFPSRSSSYVISNPKMTYYSSGTIVGTYRTLSNQGLTLWSGSASQSTILVDPQGTSNEMGVDAMGTNPSCSTYTTDSIPIQSPRASTISRLWMCTKKLKKNDSESFDSIESDIHLNQE